MRSAIPLGHVARTRIYVDWSTALIALLLTWNLTSLFAAWHPNWGVVKCLIVAAVATLLFFSSVAALVVAHAVAARALGAPVRSVTLWPFGGVTDGAHAPRSPKEEFMLAAVGPLTSLALGAVFLGLGALGVARVERMVDDPREVFAALGPLPTLLLWLGPVNVTLGLFNLLPAFPLAGGRMLRAGLWSASGDLPRATRHASGVGVVVAWALIVAGVAMAFGARVPLFGTGFLQGLWLAFVGWFLHGAAARTWEQSVVTESLGGVPVERLMRRNGPVAPPDLTVSRFVHEHLMTSEERVWPVLEGDTFHGVVCLADVRKVPRAAWDTTTLRQVMTPAGDLLSVEPDDDAADALQKLARRNVSQLPVVSGRRLVGMLHLRDLSRWLELQPRDDAPPTGPAAPLPT